ncbi:PAS domain-containing protein, partial [Herbaspirillum sp.]
MKTNLPSLDGLDLLASAVIILDQRGGIVYANAAAENLLESSFKVLSQQKLPELFLNGAELSALFSQAIEHQFADKRLDLVLERASREPLQVHAIVTPLDNPDTPVLLELRENVQQLKLDREERMFD